MGKLYHPNNIKLTQQMWQNKNIKYVILLQNLRNGIISNSNFDFDLLKPHSFNNINVNLFDDPWKTTTFIVFRNELQNAINQQMRHINSIELKQMTIDIYKKIQYKMTYNTS